MTGPIIEIGDGVTEILNSEQSRIYLLFIFFQLKDEFCVCSLTCSSLPNDYLQKLLSVKCEAGGPL